MIHERAQFEKILDRWEEYAHQQADYWLNQKDDNKMFIRYIGWESCIACIRMDLDELCEKEVGQMFEDLKKKEGFMRLSEIIET